MNLHRVVFSCLIASLIQTTVFAQEQIRVSGSSNQFPSSIFQMVNNQKVDLRITGTALREKLFINVYAVASYINQAASVETASELCSLDQHKILHLKMERKVNGKEMAENVSKSILANYPDNRFGAEMDKVKAFMTKAGSVNNGDQVWITHLPGIGVHFNIAGKHSLLVKNPAFSKAVWEIYLGEKNIGDNIKKSLVSRL